MSSTTGCLLSLHFSVSGNPISSFSRKSLSADESSQGLWSLLFNYSFGGIFFVRLAQQRWPWTAGLWKELFACFLVAWFGTTLPPVYHTVRTENEQAIIITFCHKLLSLAFCFPSLVTHMLAQQSTQYTFIGNKLRFQCKTYGIGGLFVKLLHQSFFPDHTILAMFFHSSKIRKVTTDLPDGKHMSSRPPRQGASVKTVIPCMSACHMSTLLDFNRSTGHNLGHWASEWPPLHSHLHCMLDGLDHCKGVSARGQARTGAKRKQQCPGLTPPPLYDPFEAFHIGQASLQFRALKCNSSSPPACDEPSSRGLPAHRVVSPSSLLILGSHHTQAAGLPVSDVECHTADSPQL